VIFDEVSDPLSTTIGSLDITVNGWQQFVDGQNETKFGMLIVGKKVFNRIVQHKNPPTFFILYLFFLLVVVFGNVFFSWFCVSMAAPKRTRRPKFEIH
jgi:hypothetical protein